MATGIQEATSTCACIWCKCSAENQGDTSAQWPLDDYSSDGSRTIQNTAISKLPKSKRKWNVVNAPLFPTIPLSRVAINNLHLFFQPPIWCKCVRAIAKTTKIDNLHLFLRVFDVLMDCLITNLIRRMCAIAKPSKTFLWWTGTR